MSNIESDCDGNRIERFPELVDFFDYWVFCTVREMKTSILVLPIAVVSKFLEIRIHEIRIHDFVAEILSFGARRSGIRRGIKLSEFPPVFFKDIFGTQLPPTRQRDHFPGDCCDRRHVCT